VGRATSLRYVENISKIWFITGTSRGFGRVWAEAALRRGDKVVATARDTGSLSDLVERYGENVLPIELDVTDKSAVDAAVKQAHEHFGRLDVVVNNAGYGLFGTIEEVSEEQARAQIETNLFGALWVTKAALPYLREQGSGHIIQVSSIGGVHAFPTVGLYHASKWALEGFTQALNAEVHDMGIDVTIVEPGGYATDWGGSSAVRAERLPAYEETWKKREEMFASASRNRGVPKATGPAILQVVDAEKPPLRIFFGAAPLQMIRPEYAQRIATWEEWDELSKAAHGSHES
jgi:NAD(P)-dependent dehydrogenase (short-subunit alcohol dehydrogenase family)